MGMFDYIRIEKPCVKCQTPIKEWQTKSRRCEMKELEIDEVDNFYAMCPKCRKWNEYKVVVVQKAKVDLVFIEDPNK